MAENIEAAEAMENEQAAPADAPAQEGEKSRYSWYVVHTYSGYEDKVKTNIENTIVNRHLEDKIIEVRVPVQDVVEYRDGAKKTVRRKLFPGYVLLNMDMDDETWYVVRNTRGVTGFVGPGSKPVPLSDAEIKPLGIKTETNMTVDFGVGDTIAVVALIIVGAAFIVFLTSIVFILRISGTDPYLALRREE